MGVDIVEIPTVDQQIMQYTKTQYKIYFYNALWKLNRIEQDQENTYNWEWEINHT